MRVSKNKSCASLSGGKSVGTYMYRRVETLTDHKKMDKSFVSNKHLSIVFFL
jgi:hypothetical protein